MNVIRLLISETRRTWLGKNIFALLFLEKLKLQEFNLVIGTFFSLSTLVPFLSLLAPTQKAFGNKTTSRIQLIRRLYESPINDWEM